MASPIDVGMSPPPSTDVVSQMRPTPGAEQASPLGGGSGLGGMFGNQTIMSSLETTKLIIQVAPLLVELAKMVPALAPDIGALAVRMKGRLSGAPSGTPPDVIGGGGQPGAPAPQPGTPLPPGGPQPGAGVLPPPPAQPEAAPATPAVQPPAPYAFGAPGAPPISPAGAPTGQPPPVGGMVPPPGAIPQGAPVPTAAGVMGIVQQLELALPEIATKDASLAPDIQFFVARMREEVPKVIEGQTANNMTPPPTDQMLNRIPVSV